MSVVTDTIAYFSMEIALEPAMPAYSGGLGVLACDTIRSAADLKVPGGRSDAVAPEGLLQSEARPERLANRVTRRMAREGVLPRTPSARLPGWREDKSSLRNALRIPVEEIWKAHTTAKARLKIVYAGKAHPHDEPGKHIIQKIVRAKASLCAEVKIVYLENYGWDLARLLTAGVDVWLNTPQPPIEASGASGTKAALNGAPSLSVLDGWWIEGCIEEVTGWAIGDHSDAASLYEKLEHVVLSRFYQQRDQFVRIMRQAIALNASHFNTQRMVQEYVVKAYLG